MRVILAIFILLAVACTPTRPTPAPTPVPIPKEESTLTWDRNSETDMQDYVVYGCFTKDCADLQPQGTVVQPPPTVGRPEFKIMLTGKVGVLAVTARNTSAESAFSELVPFDKR